MLTNTERKEFRYTKKEQLLGIGWLIAFIFFSGMGASIPFIVKRQTSSDMYAMLSWFTGCFIGILYSINLWLRRRGFSIKVDDDGLIIVKLGKSKRIYWKDIKSYVYQSGHPFWFISLSLINKKYINIHGELENFDELISVIKERVKCSSNEFQYTMRRRMNILVSVILLFINILIPSISLIDVITGRIPWTDALGIVGLFLLFSLGAIFDLFGKGHVQLFVTKECIIMKPWLRRRVFIAWSEITDPSQIKIGNTMLTLTEKGWKLTIRTKHTISFYEDLDNVKELVNIIETKTGISLGI